MSEEGDARRLLIEQDQLADAVRVLAHGLPKRAAVWWGCLAVWHIHRPDLPPAMQAPLQAAVCWVQDPSDANRQCCGEPGRLAKFDTSADCLAWAAFWSDGSMSLPELPIVAPPEHLTGRVAAGAVLLAAVEREPMEYRKHYHEFLALGLQILDGELTWLSGRKPSQQPASMPVPDPAAGVERAVEV